MRRSAGGKKRDAVEGDVVSALRAVGAQVWYVSGAGLPDLLCLFRTRYYVLEVKSARGRPTRAQVGAPWPIVHTPDQALDVLGVTRR